MSFCGKVVTVTICKWLLCVSSCLNERIHRMLILLRSKVKKIFCRITFIAIYFHKRSIWLLLILVSIYIYIYLINLLFQFSDRYVCVEKSYGSFLSACLGIYSVQMRVDYDTYILNISDNKNERLYEEKKCWLILKQTSAWKNEDKQLSENYSILQYYCMSCN